MKFCILVTVLAVLCGLGVAADRPSFTGKWALDTAQSTGSIPEWSAMDVGQNGRWFRVAETDKNGRQVKTFEGECRTDGRFHPVEGAQGGSISCKWDGSTLVTREHWGENDQNERIVRTTLQPDGMLVQDIRVAGPGASGNAHLVWRKQ